MSFYFVKLLKRYLIGEIAREKKCTDLGWERMVGGGGGGATDHWSEFIIINFCVLVSRKPQYKDVYRRTI